MDVAILNAEHLPNRDGRLLAAATTAAGRNLDLVHARQSSPAEQAAASGELDAWAPALSASKLLELVTQHPDRHGRLTTWPCQAVLATGTGMAAAGGCDHADAVACVLAWCGHAYATARTTAEATQHRRHELSRAADPNAEGP